MTNVNSYSLGFSSCPNDTFIFDAMINGKIDAGDLHFEVKIEDVESLNRHALSGTMDVLKISYHTLLHVKNEYTLLHSGSALGHGCGPLIIARTPLDIRVLDDNRIGIPGKYTTANLLLQLYYGKPLSARTYVFSDIEKALLDSEIDAGVIIHENRFTYESKGLVKIVDLGEFWETGFGLPLPLGCIVAKKTLGTPAIQAIEYTLRKSVQFAMDHPGETMGFVKKHAQELNDDIIKKHIDLYVNGYTLDIGTIGQKAIECLNKQASAILAAPA